MVRLCSPLLLISPAQAQQKLNDLYSSCRLYDDQQRVYGGFDGCDERLIEELKNECLLDGGTISWPPDAGSSW